MFCACANALYAEMIYWAELPGCGVHRRCAYVNNFGFARPEKKLAFRSTAYVIFAQAK